MATKKVTPPKLVPRPKTAAQRARRVQKIMELLDQMYPDVKVPLYHRNAWELLVATILSAQCTDKRVNEVTPALFRKYPTMADFANANQAELAQDIRSTGFFNNKAKSLIGAARKILSDFGGQVPRNHAGIADHSRRGAQNCQRGSRRRASASWRASSSIPTCSASRSAWT